MSEEIKLIPLDKEIVIKNYKTLSLVSKQIEGDYWTLENYLTELPMKWKLSEVCLMGSDIIGFNIASLREECFHIHRIVVSENHQNLGVGSLMINSLVEKAKMHKVTSISLKVSTLNKKAFQFYLKRGFINTGISQNQVNPEISSFILKLIVLL